MTTERRFENSYNNWERAESYARLEFTGTYYLAYRDLPAIIFKHVTGKRAVDFGCGAGRSTRFLRKLGFEAVGIDISAEMIEKAQALDPVGDYRIVSDGDYDQVGQRQFDLVLAVFTFDNIPSAENRANLLRALKRLLRPGGKIILLDSTPELYGLDWVSFSTSHFPENHRKTSGSIVKTIIEGIGDNRPVEDIFWTDADYRALFEAAGLELVESYRPLAIKSEPYDWINETKVAPWVIYVVRITES